MEWPFSLTIGQATEIQNGLRKKIRIIPLHKRPRYIAGVDAAFSEDRVFAAGCLYLFPEFDLIDMESCSQPLRFPYVPGYLAFREGPALLTVIERFLRKPDLLLIDGQGIAHPRGIGIASHLGVLTGIPAVGCAKSRLVGSYAEPETGKGAWSPLVWEGRTAGAVVRTRAATRPLFISPGHNADLASTLPIILACTRAYRLTEPLRCAHVLSKKLKNSES